MRSCHPRLLLFLALTVLGGAADAPPAPRGLAPDKADERSGWVFSILPKSLQKNPLLDLTVMTEMTDAGRSRPPVTPQNPAYFDTFSSGFRQLGDAPGDEKTLTADQVREVLTRSLAANGYYPAKLPEHPPSILIIYMWGSHNRKEEGDPDNPSMSGATLAANILDRASLVGGPKFAEHLLQLFEEADDIEATTPQHLAPGAQPVMTPELAAFSNPVAMFRRQSPKNEALLEQTANDIYYVVASAYDYKLMTGNRRTLLWRTRMTVAAQGVSQIQTLPTLVLSAAPYFGRDMEESALITKRTLKGTVEVGTPVVVPPASVAPTKEK